MADRRAGNGSRAVMEDIKDVRRRLNTEESIVHGISTEQRARMAEHGDPGEKNGRERGTVKEHAGNDDFNDVIGNDRVVRGRKRSGRPRGRDKGNVNVGG